MAGQQPGAEQSCVHTAPPDGLDTALPSRPCPSADSAPSGSGTRGRITDGGGPKIGLGRRPRWPAALASARRDRL
jgi:hypothetical protein